MFFAGQRENGFYLHGIFGDGNNAPFGLQLIGGEGGDVSDIEVFGKFGRDLVGTQAIHFLIL